MPTLSFRQKLWLPLVISLIALLLVSISSAWLSYQTRMEERRNDLTNVAHVGLSIVREYAALAQRGVLTDAQARKEALERLRSVRYGSDGYFIVIDSSPRMIMHPIKPDTVGKDLRHVADADGRHHYLTFASVAQSPQGGFVDYVFAHPNAHPAKAVDKLGYVIRYAPWDWIISTGAYIDDIQAAFAKSLCLSAGVFALLAALLALNVVYTNRGIERMIGGDPRIAAHMAGVIASGDLATPFATRREDRSSLMFAISQMRDALANAVAQIRASAGYVATTAGEIADSNMDLSSHTECQATALQQAASSMQRLTERVRDTADRARAASELAGSAARITDRGGDMVVRVVAAMNDIRAESRKMVDIIGVIEGIAFQTNILALNAAVEAARAGNEGRGFAVVASEVRVLAQRSASAAKDIRALIGRAAERVGNGAELVEATGATIGEAQHAICRVTGIVQDIAAAATDQSQGLEQINAAVSQMDSVTRRNATLVEHAAIAAQSLNEQSRCLQDAVAAFRTEALGC
ncbi:methyl-accepting chemotaxis transducer transmembrane protein [Burkholderia pseudomallei]|nr:methyl-accepting chemotaxis transducer transmembrane protein [Burkholderia pseudomallei]